MKKIVLFFIFLFKYTSFMSIFWYFELQYVCLIGYFAVFELFYYNFKHLIFKYFILSINQLCSVLGLTNCVIIKVEDLEDIHKVLANNVSGAPDVKDGTIGDQQEKHEDSAQASSVEINSSKLPPHIVLAMPALSPTMVIN